VVQLQEELLNDLKKLAKYYESMTPTSRDAAKLPRNMAQIAGMGDTLRVVQYNLEHPAVPHRPIRPGEQPPVVPQTFAKKVAQLIEGAHRAVAVRNKKPVAKEIEYHVNELIKQLRAFNASENDEVFWALGRIRLRAMLVGHASVRQQLGWVRRDFVEGLRRAAKEAGEGLSLNRRKEGGPLADAIALLLPYLPTELRSGMSFATLRRICVAQNRGKRLKKH
jgi:hypothetical protein